MTIYTNKDTTKKEDSNKVAPEVVTEGELLVDGKDAVVPSRTVVAVTARRRRLCLFKLCAILLTMTLVLIVILVGVKLYHTLRKPELFIGRCGVRYHRIGMDNKMFSGPGEFEQLIQIDDMTHERIEVPRIADTRSATILHDFSQNVTAIVDKDQSVCFLMPLNRTLVKPPENFLDMLLKLKSGYYIPDVNIVSQNYRTVTPALRDLTQYGHSVWKECHDFQTFRLVREGDPVAMSKRSAVWCPYSGDKWCLGADGGGGDMLCITVTGCM